MDASTPTNPHPPAMSDATINTTNDSPSHQVWVQPKEWKRGSGPAPWWCQSSGPLPQMLNTAEVMARAFPEYYIALVPGGSFPITWGRHQELCSDSVELHLLRRSLLQLAEALGFDLYDWRDQDEDGRAEPDTEELLAFIECAAPQPPIPTPQP